MAELAYVNGQFRDIDQATVSINDRGFQFADSVYEVLVACGHQPFRLPQHLARLRRSLALIDIDVARCNVDFEALILEGIRRAGFERTLVYLQVTRGVQPREHVYSQDLRPSIVATFRPQPVIDSQLQARGLSVTTVDDPRRSDCEVKATALLPNVLALNRAVRDGHDDVLFVGPDGDVREASSANVFAVRRGTLITPVQNALILHGVTRGYILECAEKIGVALQETSLSVAQLESADEAFLSSTTIDILPITRINGTPVGPGRPGPITARLHQAFLAGLPRAT